MIIIAIVLIIIAVVAAFSVQNAAPVTVSLDKIKLHDACMNNLVETGL